MGQEEGEAPQPRLRGHQPQLAWFNTESRRQSEHSSENIKANVTLARMAPRCPSGSAQPPAAGGRFPGLVYVRAWKSPSVPPAKGVSTPALQRTVMGRQRKSSLSPGRGEGPGQLLSPLQTVHPGSSSCSKTSLRWLHREGGKAAGFLFPNWLFQFVPYLQALGNQIS